MGYCEITDVEARLGAGLTEVEADALSVFIEDFSAFLGYEVAGAGKEVGTGPGQVSPASLKIVTANRAVSKFLTRDLAPGVVSFSKGMGDISQSMTLSGGPKGDAFGDLWISTQERRFLGISLSDKILLSGVKGVRR